MAKKKDEEAQTTSTNTTSSYRQKMIDSGINPDTGVATVVESNPSAYKTYASTVNSATPGFTEAANSEQGKAYSEYFQNSLKAYRESKAAEEEIKQNATSTAVNSKDKEKTSSSYAKAAEDLTAKIDSGELEGDELYEAQKELYQAELTSQYADWIQGFQDFRANSAENEAIRTTSKEIEDSISSNKYDSAEDFNNGMQTMKTQYQKEYDDATASGDYMTAAAAKGALSAIDSYIAQTDTSEAKATLDEYSEGGNVDLTNRPTVSASQMIDAGYDDVEEGSTKVYTSTFSNSDGTASANFTPIRVDKNGKLIFVMNKDAFETYCQEVIDGKREDTFGLQIGSVFTGDNSLNDATYRAQEIQLASEGYYSPVDMLQELASHNTAYIAAADNSATAQAGVVASENVNQIIAESMDSSTAFTDVRTKVQKLYDDTLESIHEKGKSSSELEQEQSELKVYKNALEQLDAIRGGVTDAESLFTSETYGPDYDWDAAYDDAVKQFDSATTVSSLTEATNTITKYYQHCTDDYEKQRASEFLSLWAQENAGDKTTSALEDEILSVSGNIRGGNADTGKITVEEIRDNYLYNRSQNGDDGYGTDTLGVLLQAWDTSNSYSSYYSGYVKSMDDEEFSTFLTDFYTDQQTRSDLQEHLDDLKNNEPGVIHQLGMEDTDAYSSEEHQEWQKEVDDTQAKIDAIDAKYPNLTKADQAKITMRSGSIALETSASSASDFKKVSNQEVDQNTHLELRTRINVLPQVLNLTVDSTGSVDADLQTETKIPYWDCMTETQQKTLAYYINSGDQETAQEYFSDIELDLESEWKKRLLQVSTDHPLKSIGADCLYQATLSGVGTVVLHALSLGEEAISYLANGYTFGYENISLAGASSTMREGATAGGVNAYLKYLHPDVVEMSNDLDALNAADMSVNPDDQNSVSDYESQVASIESKWGMSLSDIEKRVSSKEAAAEAHVGLVVSLLENAARMAPERLTSYLTAKDLQDAGATSEYIQNVLDKDQRIPLAMMGASVAAETLEEKLADGQTFGKALSYAAITGYMEYITEVIGGEAFSKFVTNTGGKLTNKVIGSLVTNSDGSYKWPTIARALRTVMPGFESALSEGAEEVMSGVVDGVADILINGDDSEYYMNYQAALEQGMTPEQAKRYALKQFAESVGSDFLAGALSGAVFVGTSGIANKGLQLWNHITGQDVGKTYKGDSAGTIKLINDGLEFGTDTETYKLAKTLDDALNDSGGLVELLSESDIGALAQSIWDDRVNLESPTLTFDMTTVGVDSNAAVSDIAATLVSDCNMTLTQANRVNNVLTKVLNKSEITDEEITSMNLGKNSNARTYISSLLGYKMENGSVDDFRIAVQTFNTTEEKSAVVKEASKGVREKIGETLVRVKAAVRKQNRQAAIEQQAAADVDAAEKNTQDEVRTEGQVDNLVDQDTKFVSSSAGGSVNAPVAGGVDNNTPSGTKTSAPSTSSAPVGTVTGSEHTVSTPVAPKRTVAQQTQHVVMQHNTMAKEMRKVAAFKDITDDEVKKKYDEAVSKATADSPSYMSLSKTRALTFDADGNVAVLDRQDVIHMYTDKNGDYAFDDDKAINAADELFALIAKSGNGVFSKSMLQDAADMAKTRFSRRYTKAYPNRRLECVVDTVRDMLTNFKWINDVVVDYDISTDNLDKNGWYDSKTKTIHINGNLGAMAQMNPNGVGYSIYSAERTALFVIGHETVHAIKKENPATLQEFKKLWLQTQSSSYETAEEEWDEQVKKYKDLYSDEYSAAMIDEGAEEELICDTIGKMFATHNTLMNVAENIEDIDDRSNIGKFFDSIATTIRDFGTAAWGKVSSKGKAKAQYRKAVQAVDTILEQNIREVIGEHYCGESLETARSLLNAHANEGIDQAYDNVKSMLEAAVADNSDLIMDLTKRIKDEKDEDAKKSAKKALAEAKENQKKYQETLDHLDEQVKFLKENILFTDSEAEQTLSNAGVQVDEETESAAPNSYSRSTWEASDYVTNRKAAAKELATRLKITQKKALKYIDDINSIAKMIADDKERLDYQSSPGRSSFVGNSEYGGSFDFSTVCKKRRLFTGTFSAVQKALSKISLTKDDVLHLRDMMAKKGYEVNCGLCYVEGARTGFSRYVGQYFVDYAGQHPGNDLYKQGMTIYDFATPQGQEDVRLDHPEVYEDFVSWINAGGKYKNPARAVGRYAPGKKVKGLFASQARPKMYQLATAYNSEILNEVYQGSKTKKYTDENGVERKGYTADEGVKLKNRQGGIRLQSFSDFEIIHLIDCMQLITDMARVGLAGQAYTKVPNFARALGATGLKINLSLISGGVDENGNLILDDVEGMPLADAMALRDEFHENVGTIVVVFTDEELKAAMADDRIDFIIPFHRSQWTKKDYTKIGLSERTKDFTSKQNESYIDKTQDKGRPENYYPNAYWDYNKSGKENAEMYLRMCNANNRRPKFYQVLDKNSDGSYSLKKDGSTDGYWKLLIDFKMYDHVTGKGSPQVPVTPNFRMDYCMQMLDEYEGGHSDYPVAQDIVDEFVAEIKSENRKEVEIPSNLLDGLDETQYSKSQMDEDYFAAVDEAKQSGDYSKVQEMVSQAAESAGYSTHAYHGTYNFGRTKFSSEWPTFLTSRVDTAQNFSGGIGTRALTSSNNIDTMSESDLLERANTSTIYKNARPATQEDLDYELRTANEWYRNKMQSSFDNGEKMYFYYGELWHDTYINDGLVTLDKIKEELKRKSARSSNGGTYNLYARLGKTLTVDGKESYYSEIPITGDLKTSIGSDTASTDEILKYAADHNYDSVEYKDIIEGGDYGYAGLSTVYAIVDPSNNIKSADPVTYDDSGNVIPLSERFNPEETDIRYSLSLVELDDIMSATGKRGITWNNGNSIELTGTERNSLISNLNTEYYYSNKKHDGIQIAHTSQYGKTRVYAYLYEDHGYDAYNIVGKISYKYQEDLIRVIGELIDNDDADATGLYQGIEGARTFQGNYNSGWYHDSGAEVNDRDGGQNNSSIGQWSGDNGRSGTADHGGYDEGSVSTDLADSYTDRLIDALKDTDPYKKELQNIRGKDYTRISKIANELRKRKNGVGKIADRVYVYAGQVANATASNIRYSISAGALSPDQIENIDRDVKLALNIRNTRAKFVDRILSGQKTIETRSMAAAKHLNLQIGDKVGIVDTGKNGKPLRGYAEIVDIIEYPGTPEGIQKFRDDETRTDGTGHFVSEGSKYDIDSNGKVGYVLKTYKVIDRQNWIPTTQDGSNYGSRGVQYSKSDIISDEFKDWFGDWENDPANASKIVNADGTPKVMYHGTSSDFTVFKQDYRGASWFTSSKTNAEHYGRGQKQMEVYLDVKNPYTITVSANENWDIDQAVNKARSGGYDGLIVRFRVPADSPSVDEFNRKFFARLDNDDEVSYEDKVKFLNNFYDFSGMAEMLREDESLNDFADRMINDGYDYVAVFNPKQVKSATDNVGSYDKTNPDINYSKSTFDTEALSNNVATADTIVNNIITTYGLAIKPAYIMNRVKDLIARANSGDFFEPDELRYYCDDIAYDAITNSNLAKGIIKKPSDRIVSDIGKYLYDQLNVGESTPVEAKLAETPEEQNLLDAAEDIATEVESAPKIIDSVATVRDAVIEDTKDAPPVVQEMGSEIVSVLNEEKRAAARDVEDDETVTDRALEEAGIPQKTEAQAAEDWKKSLKARQLANQRAFETMTSQERLNAIISRIMQKPTGTSGQLVSNRMHTFEDMGFVSDIKAAQDYKHYLKSNPDSLKTATERLDSDMEGWLHQLINQRTEDWTAEDVFTGFILATHLQEEAQHAGVSWNDRDKLLLALANAGSNAGQVLQAFSVFSRTGMGVAVRARQQIEENVINAKGDSKTLTDIQDELNGKLQQELTDALRERNEALKKIEQLEKSIKDLNKRLKQSDAENAELKQKLQKQIEQYARLKAQYNSIINMLEEERKKFISKYVGQSASLNKHNEDLVIEYLQYMIKIRQLTSQLNNMYTRINALNELANKIRDGASLDDILTDMEALTSELEHQTKRFKWARNSLKKAAAKYYKGKSTMELTGDALNDEVINCLNEVMGRVLTSAQKQKLIQEIMDYGQMIDSWHSGEGLEGEERTKLQNDMIEAINKMATTRGMKPGRMFNSILQKQDIPYLREYSYAMLLSIPGDYAQTAFKQFFSLKGASSLQYLAQLLNPRTWMRNLASNTVFYGVNAMARNTASVVDCAIGHFTGQRTIGRSTYQTINKMIDGLEKQCKQYDDMIHNGEEFTDEQNEAYGKLVTAIDNLKQLAYMTGDSGDNGRVKGALKRAGRSFLEVRGDVATGYSDEKYREETRQMSLQRAIDTFNTIRGKNDPNLRDQAVQSLYAELKDWENSPKSWRRQFKVAQNGVWGGVAKTLSWAEMINGYALNVSDEIFKGAIFQSSINAYARMVADGKMTVDDAIRYASEDMLYATFQDETKLGTVLNDLHDTLNFGQDFGFGDILIKYRTVPGALVTRSIEFSPAGMITVAHQLGKMAIEHQDISADTQRRLSLAIGRVLTGAMVIALSAMLALHGIMKSPDDEDDDNVAAELRARGLNGRMINFRGLSEYISSGFDPDYYCDWSDGDYDALFDIGFMDPVGSNFIIGNNIGNSIKSEPEKWKTFFGMVGGVTEATTGGLGSTIGDLSMMDTINDIMYVYSSTYPNAEQRTDMDKIVDVGFSVATSAITGFQWSFVRQLAQGFDNTYRDTYAPGAISKQGGTLAEGAQHLVYSVMANVPFLRNQVPAKQDNYGNTKIYSNADSLMGRFIANMLNATINPGKGYTWSPDEIDDAVMEVYRATGDSDIVLSRNAPSKISIKGVSVELTDDQKAEYKEARNAVYSPIVNELLASDEWKTASWEEKEDWLRDALNYAESKVAQTIWEESPEREEYIADLKSSDDYAKATETEKAQMLVDADNANTSWDKTDELIDDGLSWVQSRTLINGIAKINSDDYSDRYFTVNEDTDLHEAISGAKAYDSMQLISDLDIDDEAKLNITESMVSTSYGSVAEMMDAGLDYNSSVELYKGFKDIDNDTSDTYYYTNEDGERKAITGAKNQAKMTVIDALDLTDDQKIQIVNDQVSESQAEHFTALKNADPSLTFTDLNSIYNKYNEIDNMSTDELETISSTNKATYFDAELTRMGYTADQRSAIEEEYVMRMSMRQQINTQYSRMSDAGMDVDVASDILDTVAALEPADGRSTVSEAQKYAAISGMDIGDDDKLIAYRSFASTENESTGSAERSVLNLVDDNTARSMISLYSRTGDASYLSKQVGSTYSVDGVTYDYTDTQQSTYATSYANAITSMGNSTDISGTYTQSDGEEGSMSDKALDMASAYAAYKAVGSGKDYDDLSSTQKQGYKMANAESDYGVTPAEYLEYYTEVQDIKYEKSSGETAAIKSYLSSVASNTAEYKYLVQCFVSWKYWDKHSS